MTELEARDNSFAQAFFGRARQQLERLEDEADLAGLFFELSSAAFHGFEFSPAEAQAVDALLARAETIAFTLSAPDQDAH